MSHAIQCTIDLDAEGRHVGQLEVPTSSNTSGWGSLWTPIVSVSNGPGQTALVMGGTHGDEYEGQIAALKLFRDLRPEQVRGRVIIIPIQSMQASRAGTRLWANGANLNRSFPGRIDGPPNEQLAHFLSTVLFPISDYIIDMHGGGDSARFIPCSHMHVVEDAAQRKAMLEGMQAWNSDFHFLYIDIAGTGLLPVEAERQGKTVITTELGGGGYVTASTHRLAYSGLQNVLRHAGILEGDVLRRDEPAVILDGRDPANYVMAPCSGIYESVVELTETVTAGQVVGRIYSREFPDREPVPVRAELDGVTTVIRAIVNCEQGDSVFVSGQPIAPEALL